jgi:CHAT domain-containing protein/tetratricopeptide (TPR) repeat protein
LQAQSAFRHGDFKSSLALAQAGLRRWPAGDPGWQFRLLCVENLKNLARVKEAQELLQKPESPSGAALEARWKLDRAWLALNLTSDQKRALLQEALATALRVGDSELICIIRFRLGDIAPNFDQREAYYRAVLAEAERRHDPYLLAWAWLDLGWARTKVARFDEAVPYLQKALEIARPVDAQRSIAMSLGNLGLCYISLGDLDQAMRSYNDAEALSAKIGLRDVEPLWLTSIGNIYMNRGDLDRAAAYQQRALTIARDVGNDTSAAMVLNNLALVSLRKGDLAAAQSYNDQALTIKRQLADLWSLVYSELNAAEIESRQHRYAQAEADYRVIIQQAPEASAPDTLWAAYGQMGDMYQQSHRPKLAEAQFKKAIETIDREWNKLSSEDFRATFLAPIHLIGVFQDYVAFLIDTGQTDRALEMAESSRARVLSQKLERAEALPPNLQVQKLLSMARSSHTIILSYWLAPGRSSVWLIGPAGLTHKPLPPSRQLDDLVRKHTDAITGGEDPLAAGAASFALYKAVLEPVHQLIPPGSNVIIVPDGALHQLNFETLVVPEPRPHYWIEDVAISTAPSLRVLQPADSNRRAPRLLLLGDPVLTGQEFGPLPNVKREIAAVENHFPANARIAFTGAAAVPAEYVRASPANFTHIHFATHAAASKESPLNSAIILSHQGETFKLYARDVAPVHLTADLVTISACKSAGPKAYSGEGLMGFAWAFLYAGAQNVIATLWDEDDATSVDLMRGLYDGIAAGETPARALRSAQLALLHSGGKGRLPYYWGPLVVFTRQIGEKP